MDRLRHLIFTLALLSFGPAACKDESASGAPLPGRVAAVKTASADKALASFCEATFPPGGEGARKWGAPPERPLPGGHVSKADPAKGWTWVNLWASWCGPCVEEMPLLERWSETLKSEGIAVRIEAWSIDEVEAELNTALSRRIPGHIRWLAGPEHLEPFLLGLGVAKDSAIPIHALVDPHGMIRCVRVGAVGGQAYGAVKAILSGNG
jgi:thiol-disulfide isomerase/thioredoxin